MALQLQTYEEALQKTRAKPQKPRKPLARRKGLSPVSKRSSSLRLKSAQKAGTTAKSKKKAKRAKMPSRKSLIKKIDHLVFLIICVMYDACVECGSADRPTTGHVLSRRSYSTRWDFRNIFRQCWPCNFKAAMTAAASYHLWYVKKFGVEAFERLYRDWSKGHKYSRLELIAMVAEYQAKMADMEANPLPGE